MMAALGDEVTPIILAAGQGTRLQPLTHWVPKPLVPIEGQPVILRTLRLLADAGFVRVVVVYGRPSAVLPDLLANATLPPIEVVYALQKEQLGTGDALLTGIRAAPDSGAYLLLAGDVVYENGHLSALLERFRAGDADGCLLLKRLPPAELAHSSLVVTDPEDGTVRELIPKPSLSEIRRHHGELADASLQVYQHGIEHYLRRAPLSRTDETEVSAALTAWIGEGARLVGIVGTPPVHMTDLRDFIIHNVSYGRRLLALAEIEAAIRNRDDGDITPHVYGLTPADIPYAYRRLRKLCEGPLRPTDRARAWAVLSEVLRHQASAQGHVPGSDSLASEPVGEYESRVLAGSADAAACHHLAVAYARTANQVTADAVVADCLARAQEDRFIGPLGDRVVVRTPARLALSSSQGSDISYIIEEKSAVILNCAIQTRDGLPGLVQIERLHEPVIELESRDTSATAVLTRLGEVFGPADRSDPLVLLRAAVRFAGLLRKRPSADLPTQLAALGGGLRVTVESRLPIGSGLGCSAILAAGVLRGLREIAGLPTDLPQLLARTYLCERVYGRSGYQDIIGGAIGGVKLIEADARTGLFCPRVERLPLSAEKMAAVSEHVVLFHTGQARQRSPYLLTIAAKYFTRSADYMHAYQNGKQLTYAMRDALLTGDWQRLGELVSDYWEDRESFEEGVTPEHAGKLRRQLQPYSYGTALCGGGHGGYMMVILRRGAREAALRYLSSQGIKADQVLDYRLTGEGLRVDAG